MAPSNFCRKPKDVLFATHNTFMKLMKMQLGSLEKIVISSPVMQIILLTCAGFPSHYGNQNCVSTTSLQKGLGEEPYTHSHLLLCEDNSISSQPHRARLETISIMAHWFVAIYLYLITVAKTGRKDKLNKSNVWPY